MGEIYADVQNVACGNTQPCDLDDETCTLIGRLSDALNEMRRQRDELGHELDAARSETFQLRQELKELHSVVAATR